MSETDRPVAITARVEDQFAKRASEFDNSSRWAQDPGLLALITELLQPGDQEVVELCCGTAILGGALAQSGARVLGVDISSEMLALARARVQAVKRADAHRLPFADGRFSRIALRQAWHFLDPLRVPRELFRIAAPGARLVTAQIVPFGASDADWLKSIHKAKQRDLDWFPTEESLVLNLCAAGWELEAKREYLLEEEIHAWLKSAPETEDRVPEVLRLIRESPQAYRELHKVREDPDGLWDTFRWVVLSLRKPLSTD